MKRKRKRVKRESEEREREREGGGCVKKSIPSQTERSVELSKDLKRRGWTWIGPTTLYAFMQSMGVVNDHVAKCEIREMVERERKKLFLT